LLSLLLSCCWSERLVAVAHHKLGLQPAYDKLERRVASSSHVSHVKT